MKQEPLQAQATDGERLEKDGDCDTRQQEPGDNHGGVATPKTPPKTQKAQAINSTPSKPRIISTCRRDSVDDEIGADLLTHLRDGIDARDFLQVLAEHTQEQASASKTFDEQLKDIESWNVHTSDRYKQAEESYRLGMCGDEKKMYDHFAVMGNMFLERAESEAVSDVANQIRLHSMREKLLKETHASRKPDVVLVRSRRANGRRERHHPRIRRHSLLGRALKDPRRNLQKTTLSTSKRF